MSNTKQTSKPVITPSRPGGNLPSKTPGAKSGKGRGNAQRKGK